MRKLERPPSAPPCLVKYKHGRDNWGKVCPKCKSEIWQLLKQVQGKFCAYCERTIHGHDGHIEHFYQRGRYPKKTFSWSNLFGSCNDRQTCGNHKDNDGQAKTIDLQKVCKPDVMDASDYLQFLSEGEVVPKRNLSKSDLEIACNTITVFNLNGSSLMGRRRVAVKIFKHEVKELYEYLAVLPHEESLQQELVLQHKRAKSSEFSAALLALLHG